MREMKLKSTLLDGKQPRAHTQCKQRCDSLLMIKVNRVDIDSNRDRKRERERGEGRETVKCKIEEIEISLIFSFSQLYSCFIISAFMRSSLSRLECALLGISCITCWHALRILNAKLRIRSVNSLS